jgi:hypothetical protein
MAGNWISGPELNYEHKINNGRELFGASGGAGNRVGFCAGKKRVFI